jgi:HEPN domain-containing protein
VAVTNETLAESYMKKCELRLETLALLLARGGHSDVVRQAQELVELALKAMLRSIGVDPPKQHDVGALLVEHAARFPPEVRDGLQRAAEISKELRRERELAFYGDVDFIPTAEYTEVQGRKAHDDAAWVFALARKAVGQRNREQVGDSATGP